MSFLPEEFKGAIYKNVPRERVFSAGARRSPKTLDAWLNDIGGFEVCVQWMVSQTFCCCSHPHTHRMVAAVIW